MLTTSFSQDEGLSQGYLEIGTRQINSSPCVSHRAPLTTTFPSSRERGREVGRAKARRKAKFFRKNLQHENCSHCRPLTEELNGRLSPAFPSCEAVVYRWDPVSVRINDQEALIKQYGSISKLDREDTNSPMTLRGAMPVFLYLETWRLNPWLSSDSFLRL